MGDSRIRIVIAKSLFDSPNDWLTKSSDPSVRVTSNETSVSFVRMYSADSTIRDVVDSNIFLRTLFFGVDSTPNTPPTNANTTKKAHPEFTLWDCTISPQDITSWPTEYPDLQGSKSKTLQAAGLFPSGTWMAIPKGITPNQFSDYDSNMYVDVQYNSSGPNGNGSTGTFEKRITGRKVELIDQTLGSKTTNDHRSSGVPLPSQIMENVSNRFAADEHEEELKRLENPELSASALRRKNMHDRAQKEAERVAKLERRILMLEELSTNSKPNKKKKVSDQVLRMLVKSRATGDKNLKEQDRLYFQCMVIVDKNSDNCSNMEKETSSKTLPDNDEPSKEYRYFSPQDTFSKIASTFSKHRQQDNEGLFVEVLCRRSMGKNREDQSILPLYRRFPLTMRVYEAKSKGYLSLSDNITNFFDDTLIIRWYEDREDATPLIQENANSKEIFDNNEETISATASTNQITMPHIIDNQTKTANNSFDGTLEFEDIELSTAIQEMDDANKKGVKKGTSAKKSAAALKVKQMKMKSIAKGNKKLKMEDRFFLEVVSISEIGKQPICDCYFLSRKDPIERITQWIDSGSGSFDKNGAESWEFLLPLENSTYRPIVTTSISMGEAEEKDICHSFDRIIIRPKRNQC